MLPGINSKVYKHNEAQRIPEPLNVCRLVFSLNVSINHMGCCMQFLFQRNLFIVSKMLNLLDCQQTNQNDYANPMLFRAFDTFEKSSKNAINRIMFTVFINLFLSLFVKTHYLEL